MDRHEFIKSDLDILADAPGNGELEIKVIESISPTLYVGKLLKHFASNPENGERVCAKVYQEEERQRSSEMAKYYSIKRNITPPLQAAIGELFCIPYNRKAGDNDNNSFSKKAVYLRAKIMDLLNIEDDTTTGYVSDNCQAMYAEVFCIDFGATLTIPLSSLLILPEKFQKWKPHCVQVVLTNTSFFDESREHSSDALKGAKRIAERKTWLGKVLLSISNTVWLNPINEYKEDPATGQISLGCNLMEELIKSKCIPATKNENHMELLFDYIRKCEPAFLNNEQNQGQGINEVENLHKLGDSILWTKLPLVAMDKKTREISQLSPMPFMVRAVLNPWEIFGTIKDTVSCDKEALRKLEEELSREMELKVKNKAIHLKDYQAFLEDRAVVAVKLEKEGKWARGIILTRNVPENFCTVFLVDYGINMFELRELAQVLPIRKVYVELPFQAICLQLAHVKPLNEEKVWGEREIKELSKLLRSKQEISVVVSFLWFNVLRGKYLIIFLKL